MNAALADWIDVCAVDDVPALGSRVVARGAAIADVALFRTASGAVFALEDRCPHRGGPLSQGIVHGERVTCPLHNWNVELASGVAVAPDHGCTNRFDVRIEGGRVWLSARALDTASAAPAVPACPMSRHTTVIPSEVEESRPLHVAPRNDAGCPEREAEIPRLRSG